MTENIQPYATLRVALRHAFFRVFGNDADIVPLYRSIEAGMPLADATDALEAFLRANGAEPGIGFDRAVLRRLRMVSE